MRLNWRTMLLVFAVLMTGATLGSAPARAADDAAAGPQCGKDEERDGNLCFPACKDDGYTRFEGDGEECWQICPSNSQDYGHVCLMGPAQLKKKRYNRGPGRPLT